MKLDDILPLLKTDKNFALLRILLIKIILNCGQNTIIENK